MSPSIIDKVMPHLWPPGRPDAAVPVFAILDAARRESIYPTLMEANVPYCCLYRGELIPALAQTAPYLVQLHPDEAFTRWILEEGWGDSWGIFLAAPEGLNALRKHFRRFLTVRNESGAKLYFRFFDPRVWRVYLPTCTEAERATVFGSILTYWTEGEEPDTLLVFRNTPRTLLQETLVLGGHGESSTSPGDRYRA